MNPAVSVILPTYNEVETVGDVIAGVRAELSGAGLTHEIVVVDDDSPDGTAAHVRRTYHSDEIRVIRRVGEQGLSSAVRRGFDAADGKVLVCMDADGQHTPAVAPKLVASIEDGADVAVGSRHVGDGGVDDDWSISRHVTSWGAAALAWATLPAARELRDPMSGCFAVSGARVREVLDNLDPHGYKILLEIIGKLEDPTVAEVGMAFRERQAGESNLDMNEMGRYAEHLAGLTLHQTGLDDMIKPPVAVRAVEAGVVSAVCVLVILLSMLVAGAVGYAVTAAAGGAMTLMFARVWGTHLTWRETTQPQFSHVEELRGEHSE